MDFGSPRPKSSGKQEQLVYILYSNFSPFSFENGARIRKPITVRKQTYKRERKRVGGCGGKRGEINSPRRVNHAYQQLFLTLLTSITD